jgi:hypothetical protein
MFRRVDRLRRLIGSGAGGDCSGPVLPLLDVKGTSPAFAARRVRERPPEPARKPRSSVTGAGSASGSHHAIDLAVMIPAPTVESPP